MARLIINASTLRGLGSALVGKSILNGINALTPHNLLKSWIPKAWNLSSPNYSLTSASIFTKPYIDNITITRAINSLRPDVLLSLTDTSTLRPGICHVLLVQQAFLAYPESSWRSFISPQQRIKQALLSYYFSLGKDHVTKFVVQTPSMKYYLMNRWRLNDNRVAIIPSSVNTAEQVDSLAFKHSGRPILACLSSPGTHKNLMILPMIMSHLRQYGMDVELFLTVEPKYVPNVRALADELGVNDMIKYTGTVSHQAAINILRASSALVAPSLIESFCLPIYEAMQLRVPIVASNLPYARDALGDSGLYAPPSRPDIFASMLYNVLSSSSVSSALKDNLQTRSRTICHNDKAIATSYLKLINSL